MFLKQIIIILIVTVFFSCKNKNQYFNLTVLNNSDTSIDSITFPHDSKLSYFSTVKSFSAKSFDVPFNTPKSPREGTFIAYIYQQGNKKVATWGFHNYGVFASGNDNIYVYDNGITYNGKEIEKPTDMNIYFENKGTFMLEDVTVACKEKARYQNDNKSIHIKVNYDDFEKHPYMYLSTKKGKKKIELKHDWGNWNDNQIVFDLFDSGEVKYAY